MSASRHTYVVVVKAVAPDISLDVQNILLWDGDGPFSTGNKKIADEKAEHMRSLYSDTTYEVIQLR